MKKLDRDGVGWCPLQGCFGTQRTRQIVPCSAPVLHQPRKADRCMETKGHCQIPGFTSYSTEGPSCLPRLIPRHSKELGRPHVACVWNLDEQCGGAWQPIANGEQIPTPPCGIHQPPKGHRPKSLIPAWSPNRQDFLHQNLRGAIGGCSAAKRIVRGAQSKVFTNGLLSPTDSWRESPHWERGCPAPVDPLKPRRADFLGMRVWAPEMQGFLRPDGTLAVFSSPTDWGPPRPTLVRLPEERVGGAGEHRERGFPCVVEAAVNSMAGRRSN